MKEGVKYSKAFLSVNIKALCCVSPIPDDTAFTVSEQSVELPQFQLQLIMINGNVLVSKHSILSEEINSQSLSSQLLLS